MLQLPPFTWTLRSSVQVFLNNFFLIKATDRSNISSVQNQLLIAVSLYPLSFFAFTPFKRKTGSFGVPSRLAWYNLHVYYTACSSWL